MGSLVEDECRTIDIERAFNNDGVTGIVDAAVTERDHICRQ